MESIPNYRLPTTDYRHRYVAGPVCTFPNNEYMMMTGVKLINSLCLKLKAFLSAPLQFYLC